VIVQAQMTEPDLAAIVEGAVMTMLDLYPGELVEDAEPTACSIGAAVQFTGDWQGAIVVGCDEAFGREAAAAMFGSEPESITHDELADALGELANMIGGNIKPLLAGAVSISLPTVAQGPELHLGIPGAEIWLGILYRRGESELSVGIYRRSPQGRIKS
jgi:chemotaxis protein CheX